MTLEAALFWLLGFAIVCAATAGIVTRSGARTRAAWFLLSSSALVGVFVLLGAYAIALAQLLFCTGFGLLLFFVIDMLAETADPVSQDSDFPWWVIVLGVSGATLLATTVAGFLPEANGLDLVSTGGGSFGSIGRQVLVDNGFATLATALALLAATIGAGFLARRGLD